MDVSKTEARWGSVRRRRWAIVGDHVANEVNGVGVERLDWSAGLKVELFQIRPDEVWIRCQLEEVERVRRVGHGAIFGVVDPEALVGAPNGTEALRAMAIIEATPSRSLFGVGTIER
jgi:hypothetical protein